MADERTITTVFKADISQFSASTQDLNRYISQVNSEFKNATASMGRWNDNAAGLQAKLNQLNGVLDAETKKLNTMEQAYADLVAQGKENSKEAQQLATKINNQQAVVKETKKNIDYYTKSLEELQDAGVETKDELDKVNKALDDQKQAAKETGDALLKGAAVGIAGIATACVGAVAGLAKLVDETKELRTQMGMLETSFEQSGLGAEAATNTYNELYGVLGDSGKATEAGLQLSQLAKSEKELNDYTNILTGVYATFGDSLPVEGLAEAMNHTANLGSVQGNLADALEWSGINVDDFNEQLGTLNTEEERAQLISDTLNGIYGESATKYKEVNGEIIEANKAQNAYNQAMADIGEKAQPIVTEFKTAMVGVLQTILAKFNEVDISGLIAKITDGITNLVNTALPPLMTAITWVLDNLDWLVPVLGTIVGLIGGISAAIKIYNTVATIARTVQLLLNAAMAANPIGIVIIAIGALVSAFVLLWNKCEGFRNFFIKMWDGIKSVAKTAGEFIGGIFGGLFDLYKAYINGIIKGVNAAIGLLNKIKIPDWEIFGDLAGKGLNIKKIPLLAKGAIIDKPTMAMVGEAGKEAVMPLENNTQWIDKLADKLNARQPAAATNNYNITNKFEKMETSRLALHKSNLELKKIMKGG